LERYENTGEALLVLRAGAWKAAAEVAKRRMVPVVFMLSVMGRISICDGKMKLCVWME
jgi:hypothetical protein